MGAKRGNMKRYNLDLPVEVFTELRDVADQHHTTVVDMVRKFIKLGLELEKISDNTLYIREGDSFSRLILL